MFIIFLGAIISQPLLALLVIALLTNTENIRRIVVFYKSKQSKQKQTKI